MANLRRLFVLQFSMAGVSTVALLLALLYLDPYHLPGLVRLLVYLVTAFAITSWSWLLLTLLQKRRKLVVRPSEVLLHFRHSVLLGLFALALVLLQSTGNFYWWSALASLLVVGGVEWLFQLS